MRPSPMCRRNRVRIQPARFDVGLAGGPSATQDPTAATMLCSVQPKSVDLVDDTGRMTRRTSLEVLFADDPGVEARDMLTWIDPTPNQTLVVLGVRIAAGMFNTWVVECELVQ